MLQVAGCRGGCHGSEWSESRRFVLCSFSHASFYHSSVDCNHISHVLDCACPVTGPLLCRGRRTKSPMWGNAEIGGTRVSSARLPILATPQTCLSLHPLRHPLLSPSIMRPTSGLSFASSFITRSSSRKNAIGFIGLGAMGKEMARNLLTKTFKEDQDAAFVVCDADPMASSEPDS